MTDTGEYFSGAGASSRGGLQILKSSLPPAPYSLPVVCTLLFHDFSLFTIPHISKDLYKPKRISLTELCSLDQIIFYFLLELAENWKISWLLWWAEMTKKWQTHQEGANPIWKSNIIFPIPHPRNISSSVQNNLGNVSNPNNTRFVSFLRRRCRGEGVERTYSNIKSRCIYSWDTCLTHQNV